MLAPPAWCGGEPPRKLFYVVPAGLALLTSLLLLLVYIPSTSVLPHTHLLHPAAGAGAHLVHARSSAGSTFGYPAPANNSAVDGAAPCSVSGLPTSAASTVKAPPLPAAVDGGADRWPRTSKEPRPAGGRREGNVIHKQVFHDEAFFLQGYREMNTSFKIFVYPHSKEDPFANALLPVDYEPGGNYASESYFKKVLMQSHFITKDPSQADLFFLPFSIATMRHDRRIGAGGIASFVQKYISKIRQKYPYWNRTGGADHFYAACHSIGRSAMDKAEEVKLNAIQVVCSASYFLGGYVAHKDLCLPQVWPRKGTPPNVASTKRRKLAFFAGAMNSRAREKVIQAWKDDPEIFVHPDRLSTPYSEALLSSKFCLHVKGFEVNTARAVDAIYYGCVPVILADHYELPFSDVLDWQSFSLVVSTLDIPLLKEILHGVSSDRYMQLHKNVLKVRKHFQWHLPPLDYDAFYMVMYELWLRRSTVRIPFV